MDITDYTTYAEVRSTVGLASKELTDTNLAEEKYANRLELDLDGVDLTDDAPGPGPLKTRFLVIDAILEASRTADEQTLYNLTRLFSTYSVSLEVVISLSMQAKTITDSKALLSRFSSESAYKDTIAAIKDNLAGVKDQIEDIGVDTVLNLPYLTVVEPDIDPVTNS